MKFQKNEKYKSIAVYSGITAIVVALVIIILANFPSVWGYVQTVLKVFEPVLYGFIMAYLINPVMSFYERKVFKFKKAKKDRKVLKRILSLILAIITVLAVISLLLYAIIPATYNSFIDFSNNVPRYVTEFQSWLDNLVKAHSGKIFNQDFSSFSEVINAYEADFSLSNITSKVLTWVQDISGNVASYATEVVSQIVNVLIGLFLMVYFLYSKEKLAAQAKKIVAAMTSRRGYINVVRFVRYTNRAFGGFITGKIIDSFVIGILALAAFGIFNIPYYPLLGALIGITNFIPTFGPIFGGAIGVILLILASPSKVIPFIIIVLIIQQLDGNIIGPAILGDSIGINAMWIIVGLSIFGGLWGFTGLIIGIPLFAVIYTLIKQWSESKLKKKNMPFHTKFYETDPTAEGEAISHIAFIGKDDEVPEVTAADDTPDENVKVKERLPQRIRKLFSKKKKKDNSKKQ